MSRQSEGGLAVTPAAAPLDLVARACEARTPGYWDAIEGLLDALPLVQAPAGAEFAVLELGAASGSLSRCVLERYGNAHVTLVEASAELLDQARQRLAAEAARSEFVAADFARIDLPGTFHLIISAFAVHKLGNIDKRALYRRAYAALVPGGTMLIADIVQPPSSKLDTHYRQRWRDLAGGADESDFIDAAEVAFDLEHGATLADQLEWLANAGLIDVDIHTKRWHFATFGGRRRDA